jgi:hypothetical protein
MKKRQEKEGKLFKIHDVVIGQIKFGEYGKKITLGGQKASDTSRYFTAILNHAANGWSKLYNRLHNSWNNVDFVLHSFVLCTNKILDAKIKEQDTVSIEEKKEVQFIYFESDDFDDIFKKEVSEMNLKLQN